MAVVSVAVQTEPGGEGMGSTVCGLPRWCFILAFLSGFLLFLVPMLLESLIEERHQRSVSATIMEDLGMEGIIMFTRHDRDADGCLSIEEFEPLAHHLLQNNETYIYETVIHAEDEVITLHAEFEPLQQSTMSNANKDKKDSGPLDPLRGLKSWRSAHTSVKKFPASHFQNFLPREASQMRNVGTVYTLIGIPDDLAPGAVFSSNRYYPNHLVDKTDIMIHQLLAMFHPRPFVLSRFAPHGSLAVVRAFKDDVVDIVFRIHAEFQLNEPPFTPFWFTPGQFTGHVTMTTDSKHILDFSLYVSTKSKLNIDMEWLTGPNRNDMEVDIGYLSKMALKPEGPSVMNSSPGESTVNGTADIDIQWTKEITVEESMQKLEIKFYPFKKVPYLDFADAFDAAEEESKLVHTVLLWGALDDQSC